MHDVKTYTETSCIVNIRNFKKPDLVAIVYILELWYISVFGNWTVFFSFIQCMLMDTRFYVMHDVKTYTETPCIVNIRNFNKPDLVAIVYILELWYISVLGNWTVFFSFIQCMLMDTRYLCYAWCYNLYRDTMYGKYPEFQ